MSASISIVYKRKQQEIPSDSYNSDSGKPGEWELNFRTIVKAFEIPFIDLCTVSKEYPKAQLEEIDEYAEDRNAVTVLDMEWNGMFSCKLGKTYRLFLGQRVVATESNISVDNDSQKSSFDDSDIEMAAILSEAVYHENPIEYINKNYSNSIYGFTSIGIKFASDASYPYLLCITKTDNSMETMWVAFRGTTNWEDILADLTIIPTLAIAGMVHQGFWKRASQFPHNRFAHECYQQQTNHKRLIFTGHSLGGAVAHLCALKHLDGKTSTEQPKIFSITFGAPFFGNRTMAEDLIKRNLNEHFLTIANEGDCVPNILNLVESVKMLGSTMQPVIKLSKIILEKFIPFFDTQSTSIESQRKDTIDHLNDIVPKLKDVLKNMNLEYKPIGTYGFIHVYAGEGNSQKCQWRIQYRNNQLNSNNNRHEFIDHISKKLTSLYGSKSQIYTDRSIVNHFMKKYIEALKSCQIIGSYGKNTREVIELNQFNPVVESALAVCHNTDIKITLTGNNLDFISTHKGNCLTSSPLLFEKNSVTISLEQTQQRVVLANNMLIPAEKWIKVGPQKYFLETHFGKIALNLLWDENMPTYSIQRGMFSKFDMNFLISAFLRSVFAYVHSNKEMIVREIINGEPTMLQYFLKLIENRLEEKFHPFMKKLQGHFNDYARRKSNNEPLIVTESLYDDSISMLQDLYQALSELPNYRFDKSIREAASENPLFFTACGVGTVVGVIIFFQAAPISVFINGLMADKVLVAASVGAESVAKIGLSGSYISVGLLQMLGKGALERLLYQGHMNLLLDSMGGESNKCADEEMTEIQICKILSEKSIDFRAINVKDGEQMKKIIEDKKVFKTKGTRERPTLNQTTIESKHQAFRLLHDVYFIHELRRYMTDHIYISFIGTHRAGKSSLLKSLWHLPAQIGDDIHSRTQQLHIYTLDDVAKNNKVHIIDFPGVTDPEKAIAQLTHYYSICSSFYIIVVQAGTDYAEASKLIRRLQSPTMTDKNQQKYIQPTNGPQPDDCGIRLNHTSIPFVVIVTHTDCLSTSLETEIQELANDRLKIDRELICPCFNKEAIKNERYVNKHKDDNLDGISHVREFLTKHFIKVFGKDHDFKEYMKYRYDQK